VSLLAGAANMDAHQTIVTAALAAKGSAESRRRLAGKLARKTVRRKISRPPVAPMTHDLAQRLSYSSWRRHQTPVSLRPLGARSSHWYMPQRPSSPRA
jgi:hypothetical protein